MGATSNSDGDQGATRPEVAQPELAPNKPDLTVCDIIGDWGHYQWSLALFALIYSALAGVFVVVGPIWTPDMNHVCKLSDNNKTTAEGASIFYKNTTSTGLHECFVQEKVREIIDGESELTSPQQSANLDPQECSQFIYDDQNYGKVLTNTVSLEFVCEHFLLPPSYKDLSDISPPQAT